MKTLILKLQEWANRNDKLAHGLLFFFFTVICPGKFWYNITHVVSWAFAIELVQKDAFSDKYDFRDGGLDLLADAIGIGLGLLARMVFMLVFITSE